MGFRAQGFGFSIYDAAFQGLGSARILQNVDPCFGGYYEFDMWGVGLILLKVVCSLVGIPSALGLGVLTMHSLFSM